MLPPSAGLATLAGQSKSSEPQVSPSYLRPDVSGDGFQQLPPASQAPNAPEVPVQDGLQFSRSGPISFVTWAAGLHLTVFASRTPFASFLKRTLHLSWTGYSPPADVLLPLPVPSSGVFKPFPGKCARSRHKAACSRLLHAVVSRAVLAYLKALVWTFGDLEEKSALQTLADA